MKIKMSGKSRNDIETMEDNDSLELKVAKAISSIRRSSERVVGVTSLDYCFLLLNYSGTTLRPVSITPLERAVVGILDIDESSSLVEIGKILGLDVIHDIAEQTMLAEAIGRMKSYGVLEGDESYLSLTSKGKIFAKEGERPETYDRKFQIFYDQAHPNYLNLQNDFKKIKHTHVKSTQLDELFLDVEKIKIFAEYQAPAVQNAKNRFVLQSLNLLGVESISVKIHVAFLQSIRDESEIRAIAFDDFQNTILPDFSDLIQLDKNWFDELLTNCITNSLNKNIEDGGWEQVSASQEKDANQKAIEAEIVKFEDDEIVGLANDGYNELERLHKKSLYDQTSFEIELENIFKIDKPDEVWMISPWVKNAFVKKRVAQFEPLLKAGKRIFIAYSEAEVDSKGIKQDMVSAQAQAELKRLNEVYPNFFSAELPVFHLKHVLEVKNGQCVLFNGSFNILSFVAVSNGGKVRREEMALVHHQTAIAKHQEYINSFSEIYLKNAIDELKLLGPEEIIKYNSDRIDYLYKISISKDKFVDFYSDLEELQLKAQNEIWLNKYDSTIDDIEKFVSLNVIGFHEHKQLNNRINSLIKESLSLTISMDLLGVLNAQSETLNRLPRKKDNKKDREFPNKTKISKIPTTELAKDILKSKKFDSELNTARYVAALNFMYSNRLFKNFGEGSQNFNALISDKNGYGNLSLLTGTVNMSTTSRADFRVGVFGYSFALFAILNADSVDKLSSKFKKPLAVKFENVNKKNLEQIFLKLLNQ